MSRVRGLLRRKGPAKDAQPERRVEAPEEIPGVIDTYRVPAGAKPESSAEVFVVEQDGVGRY
ncbi:MAG: hypothetical protein JRN56_04645, partial [Nitrososphaerota archaeon]|nr:hypothetical protein [Nitrososphaerota archaeon]